MILPLLELEFKKTKKIKPNKKRVKAVIPHPKFKKSHV